MTLLYFRKPHLLPIEMLCLPLTEMPSLRLSEPQAYGYPKCQVYGLINDRRGIWHEPYLSNLIRYA